MDGLEAVLDPAWRAVQELRWAEARRCFEAAAARDDQAAAAHDGLGLALWFLGEVPEAVRARTRAFEAYAGAGAPALAARCGVWVSHQSLLLGRASAARGWLARAARVLDGAAECSGHGWVAVERARQASPGAGQTGCAEEAVAVARRTHDGDLETLALSLLGRAEVAAGHVSRGVALMEESMTAATAGVVRDPHTLGEVYCTLVSACADRGDWERATEWCALVDAYARESGAAPLYGACRSVHAEVLLATGHWPRAEEALEAALSAHATQLPRLGAPAAASLAELRVRQGRLTDAGRLLAGRDETPVVLRALALLRVAQGRPVEATLLLERALVGSEGDLHHTSQLLAALVDARLAAGDLRGAEADCRRLTATVAVGGLRVSTARADLAGARVALARGTPDAAAGPAQRALVGFADLSMPVDVARARLELAHALSARAPGAAGEEARAALAVLSDVGASCEADAARALLRRLPDGTAGGVLTAREVEVLELVAQGLTNAQIAATLFITDKTAGHHVSHILAKLGARNRTEAAAHLTEVRGG